MKKNSSLLLALLWTSYTFCQVNYSANDTIPVFHGEFGFGINPGSHYGWQDQQLADISVEIGINSFRPALPELFLEYWGYDIRADAFYHYDTIGLKNNTVFVGYPSPEHREDSYHCATAQSETFANLYEPIWDNGEDGTLINEENYYANYLYKMVSVYKDYVKFWEIWNEPDFSFTINAVEPPTNPESWWVSNPDPCHHSFRAPITHYVRMLRISYEVIKSVDSTALITTGGLGYPSYLDAILRNTDNPDNGLISNEYPLTGGAYFDVVSFHSYPFINNSMRYWNNDINDFSYTRHSDVAKDGYINLKKEFEEVCWNYGYDGEIYPEKHWIVTETNIPRKRYADYIGSDEAQRNYLVKAAISSMKEGILQMHPYSLSELETRQNTVAPFQAMGFYEKLGEPGVDKPVPTESGIAWKTASNLLQKMKYSEDLTTKMEIPEELDGAGFIDEDGKELFVLWAKTEIDNSERAKGFYTFPENFGYNFVELKNWNYAQTNRSSIVPNHNILLRGSPIFLSNITEFPDSFLRQISILAYPNPTHNSLNIEVQNVDFEEVTISVINTNGVVVRNLLENEHLSEGVHQFTFSLQNLANGIYFLKLASGSQIKTTKIIKTSF